MHEEEPEDEIIRKVKHEDEDEFHENGDNDDSDDPEDDENEAEVVDYWQQSKEDFD